MGNGLPPIRLLLVLAEDSRLEELRREIEGFNGARAAERCLRGGDEKN